MPVLIANALIGALALAMKSLVGRVLLALGLSFVSYTGFDTLGSYALAQVSSTFSGMPSEALALLGYLWIDKAITVVFSAYTAALGIKMAGATSLIRMVRK